MTEIQPPVPKAQPLLRVIVEAIGRGRVREGDPKTFISYSEALELMALQKAAGPGNNFSGRGLMSWMNGQGAIANYPGSQP
jgi:hypothetical protein